MRTTVLSSITWPSLRRYSASSQLRRRRRLPILRTFSSQRFHSSRPHEPILHREAAPPLHESPSSLSASGPSIPDYLQQAYWWAYVNPNAVRLLDREYLVNLVLWGNAKKLRDAALDALSDNQADALIHGRTLQVACVYGSFTEHLSKRLAPDATLDVIDVVPSQLENLQKKLSRSDAADASSVTLSRCDATALSFEDDSFDQVVFFFLLHEMPHGVRMQALKEGRRVVKPGGKMVFVDFHRPASPWYRFLMSLPFHTYEPFAMDMWNHEIQNWLPKDLPHSADDGIRKNLYCDGCYQKVVVTVPKGAKTSS